MGWPQEQYSDHKDGLALQGSHKGRKVTRSWLCTVATGSYWALDSP